MRKPCFSNNEIITCPLCSKTYSYKLSSCPDCANPTREVDDKKIHTQNPKHRNEVFSSDHFQELWKFEDEHFWFQSRSRLIAWHLGEYFGSVSDFLEIGCGNGLVMSYLESRFPNTNFTGADLFSEGLAFARRRLNRSQLIRMDFLQSALRVQFDVVGLFDVIEHIDEDRLAIRKMFDSIKPGGGAIITVPQHPFLWSSTDKIAHHKRRYTKAELSGKLIEAGFKICRIVSFMSLLLPFMAISRLCQKVGGHHSGLDEFRIPPWLNNCFMVICSIERFCLRKGFIMPWGGSLMVVVKKPT